MKTITFGMYNQLFNRSRSYQEHIKFITEFTYNQMIGIYQRTTRTRVTVIEDTSVNNIIIEADRRGSDYALIVAYGFRSHSMYLHQELVDYAEKNNHAVVGHILQDNPAAPVPAFYSLHNQTLLINMEKWRSAGRPAWGDYGAVENITLPVIERSVENFHGDYTPYWIKPTGQTRTYSGVLREGWSLIKGMLENNLSIGNIPNELRKFKSHLYPESSVEFEKALANDPTANVTEFNQKQYLDHTSFKSTQGNVFILNTDFMYPERMTFNKNIKVNSLYCVAAGFKPLQLLSRVGFDNNTRMVYVDYSQSALDFKKAMFENWDGNDYFGFVEEYKKLNPSFKPVWFVGLDASAEWESTMQAVGGWERWRDLWSEYKRLPHKFLSINLFEDYSAMLSDMSAHRHGNNLIWVSNSFNTDAAVRHFPKEKLLSLYDNFLDNLRYNNNSIQICGTDHVGRDRWMHIGELK